MTSMNVVKDSFVLIAIISITIQAQDTPQQLPSFEQINEQQLPLPPFLVNASAESRRQFFSIAYNPNLKIADLNEQLEQWAHKQPKDVQDAYNQQVDAQKRMEAMMVTERNKLVQALPADAQAVAKQLDEIRENLQLTANQQMQQVTKVLYNTTPAIRQQLTHVDEQLGQMLQKLQQ
ncbi:unnamed protein product [Anisakis simplex]|uniref:DUF148 domain-containing protein n=1 Tax=Anisakis simplex TaxID=6269 RepID=A0A0M3JWR8_ANISI|nr:unnamed protein product [Anisakis simplex]